MNPRNNVLIKYNSENHIEPSYILPYNIQLLCNFYNSEKYINFKYTEITLEGFDNFQIDFYEQNRNLDWNPTKIKYLKYKTKYLNLKNKII